MSAAEVFTAGVACNALVALHSAGLLQHLAGADGFDVGELDTPERHLTSTALHGALRTLSYAKMVQRRDSRYFLTELGREVTQYSHYFLFTFGGYANLLAKQRAIACGTAQFAVEDVDGGAIATACAIMGRKSVDSIVLETLRELAPTGWICDLGCGGGKRLVDICSATGWTGIGLDINDDALALARDAALKSDQEGRVQFVKSDVTRIHGVWNDVDVVMQALMMHHIVPDEHCVEVLRSYVRTFPRARYLILLDTVTAETDELMPTLFAPAFDYVHRLQGLEPRTRPQALDVFRAAGCELLREVELGVPNTFLWVLRMPPASPS